MPPSFFEHPILNSPCEYPATHWELDKDGQPTNRIVTARRQAEFITPIPKAKKRKRKKGEQQELEIGGDTAVSTAAQKSDPKPIINELRGRVDAWRELKNPAGWGVTPDTAQLLSHWRHHAFTNIRPFFCQTEAIETLIWLTEVAPHDRHGKKFLQVIGRALRRQSYELNEQNRFNFPGSCSSSASSVRPGRSSPSGPVV